MPGIQYEFTVSVTIFLISLLFIFSYVVSVTPSPHFRTMDIAYSVSEHLLSYSGFPEDWYSRPQVKVIGLSSFYSEVCSYHAPKPLFILDAGKICCLNYSCPYYVPYSSIDANYNSSFHVRESSTCNFKSLLGLCGDDLKIVISPSLHVSANCYMVSPYTIGIEVYVQSYRGPPMQKAAVYVIIPGMWGSPTIVESSNTDSEGKASFIIDVSLYSSPRDYILVVTAYKNSLIGYTETEFRLESSGDILFGREHVKFIESYIYKYNRTYIFSSLMTNSQGIATYTRFWFNGSQAPYCSSSFTGSPKFYIPIGTGLKGPLFIAMNISLSTGERAISFIEYPMLIEYGKINLLAESVTVHFNVIIQDVIYIVEITYCHYER